MPWVYQIDIDLNPEVLFVVSKSVEQISYRKINLILAT